MNLCPLCDRKLPVGTWCKNCKRFVKPYQISSDVHINESHSESQDADCDYHNTNQTYSSVFTAQETSHKSTTSTNYHSSATVNQNRTTTGTYSSGTNTQKTASQTKTVKVVLVVIAIIWILSFLLPIIISVVKFSEFSELFDFFSSNSSGSSVSKVKDFDPELIIVNNKEWTAFCEDIDREELSDIRPVSCEGEGSEAIFFFAPDKLEKRGKKHCDDMHFSMKLDQLEYFLALIDSDYSCYTKVVDAEKNVLLYQDGNVQTIFDSKYCYQVNDTKVHASFDTVTKELHMISVYGDDANELGQTAVLLATQITDELYMPEEDLMGDIRDCVTSMEGSVSAGNPYLYTIYSDSDLTMRVYVEVQNESVIRSVIIETQ